MSTWIAQLNVIQLTGVTILFWAHIVPNLANGSFSNLVSVSFGYVLISLWEFPYFMELPVVLGLPAPDLE